jgi:rod shape-determining protein MreC
MLKRPHYIALALVIVLTVTILSLPGQTAARLKLGIGSLFLPLFGLTASSQRMMERAGDSVVPRGELLRQNEALRQENQKLRLQLDEAEKTGQENEKLRRLLFMRDDLTRRGHLKLKPGRVVNCEPTKMLRSIQIDLGSRDGLSNNLPVLAPEGSLVGKISEVTFARSQVVLLGDPKCKVGARVENVLGVIEPSGPLDSRFVEMGFISKDASLKSGQIVRTSGKGGVFPENIPIGKIVDTRSAESGLSIVARVKLDATLNALETVWVRFP